MRAKLFAAAALWLLALPAAAEPGVPPRRAAASIVRADFDLLKQAEQQSERDQAEAEANKAAAAKAAEDAAGKAAEDNAVAGRTATDAAAAKAAPSPPPAEPPKESRPVHVVMKLASGATAGTAEVGEMPGSLHLMLGFARIPAGRYKLLLLSRSGCGKPTAAPTGVTEAVPLLTAGADGTVTAAFAVRHARLGAEGLALALYPEEAKPAGAAWVACGEAR